MPGPPSPSSVLFPEGRFLTRALGQALSDLKASCQIGLWPRFKLQGLRELLLPPLGLLVEGTLGKAACLLLPESYGAGVITWP